MAKRPGVSVLVVTWNGRQHLAACLDSLVEQVPGVEHEILVHDNGSSDGTVEWMASAHPRIQWVRSETNLGFAAANNKLAELAHGDYLAFVNNDMRAEKDWLRALVDTLASAPADVAGVAGRIHDWNGERLDFGRGVVTFDGHALPLDHRRLLTRARLPESGEEAFFACGGNFIVRRRSFLDAGGFDGRYFAYYEDVDLGWRLWAGGERLIHCAEAVTRHRSSATGVRLGNRRRGSLFERNALWTVLKNFEDGMRERMLPVVLMTYLSRIEATIMAEDGASSILDGRSFAEPSRAARKFSRGAGGVDSTQGLGSRLLGLPGLRRKKGVGREAGFVVRSDQGLAQLQALSWIMAALDEVESDHRRLAHRRRVPDREIFGRFPLWIIPTYPGDARLFASESFSALLPEDLPFERASLREVLGGREPSVAATDPDRAAAPGREESAEGR